MSVYLIVMPSTRIWNTVQYIKSVDIMLLTKYSKSASTLSWKYIDMECMLKMVHSSKISYELHNKHNKHILFLPSIFTIAYLLETYVYSILAYKTYFMQTRVAHTWWYHPNISIWITKMLFLTLNAGIYLW